MDTHAEIALSMFYSDISIGISFVFLFVGAIIFYTYLPGAAPTSWKRYGIHILVAFALSIVVALLPDTHREVTERLIGAVLFLAALILAQSVAFRRYKRHQRRDTDIMPSITS